MIESYNGESGTSAIQIFLPIVLGLNEAYFFPAVTSLVAEASIRIGGPLDSVRAELETPYGKASSAWTLTNKQVVMNIIVPPNTTASVEFPDGRKAETVDAGTYRYELDIE